MGKPAALIAERKFPRAELMIRRILIDAPSCGAAHRALAHVLVETNRPAFAIPHLQKAITCQGESVDLMLQIAGALRAVPLIGRAISAARRVLSLAPDNPRAYAILANALHGDGQLDEAESVIAQGVAKFGTGPLRRVAALVRAERKDYAGAIALLPDGDLMPLELFDRGRFQESAGNYVLAWRDWMTAKKMQRALGYVWDRTRAEKRIASLYECSRPTRFKQWRGADMPARPWPLFITGFPRSGTTMVEAALSAHGMIVAGDELLFLSEVTQQLPYLARVRVAYPYAMAATSFAENAIVPSLLRDYYHRKAIDKIGAGELAGARYFTDKMPSNELHWPLISKLFPETPIVHVRRHPLDILVSNMSHDLVHGAFVSCGLESCARNMGLVDGLLAHYRDHVPGLAVHQVQYESFVADHKAAIDAMLPADLAPDPACYDFHLNPWHSRTISHRQIKQPVYDKSVGRFKPFLEFLRPVLEHVAPIMAREGYEL